ncbi:MAG: alpha/beta hydrolase [Saprospiraceae bacterium]
MKIRVTVFFLLANAFLFAQQNPLVIPLWENGAPGFEHLRGEPEQAKDYWVKNIHNPSLIAYLPKAEQANGAAIVICPGGGHEKLVITSEGHRAAQYFADLGFAAFVLKYRLFREQASPYQPKHATEDGIRAMRLVRSRAAEWGVDPQRIGIMGFSAGGELAAWVSFADPSKNGVNENDSEETDEVETVSAVPNFQVLIYPGPLAVTETLGETPPPAFLLAANDDECCSEPILKLAMMYRSANVPVELHLYAKGNHAFNMGGRSELQSIHSWPDRLQDWLLDNGWFKKKD